MPILVVIFDLKKCDFIGDFWFFSAE